MTTAEHATAHDAGDCPVDCPHPDHGFDGDIPDLWLILLGQQVEGDSARVREMAQVLYL